MKLNVCKCKELIVDGKATFLPLEIGDVLVKRVKSALVLGLILEDVKWNEHVSNIVKKAGKRLYMYVENIGTIKC